MRSTCRPASILFPLFLLLLTPLLTLAVLRNGISATEHLARGRANVWSREANADAISLFLKASEEYKAAGRFIDAAACIFDAGRQLLLADEKSMAGRHFEESLRILNNERDALLLSQINSQLVLLEIDRGDLAKAKQFLSKAYIASKISNADDAFGDFQYAAGELYYFTDETDSSLEAYNLAIHHFRAASNRDGEGKSLLGLGYLCMLRSEFQKSEQALVAALSLFEQESNTRGRALSYKALGSLYKQIGNFGKSLEYLRKAELLFPDDLDRGEKAMLFNWFGTLYEDYGNWAMSRSYRLKALYAFDKTGYFYGQMATLTSLGRLSVLLDDEPSAVEYLQKAERFATRLGDRFYLASISEERGNISFRNGLLETARTKFKECLRLLDRRLYQRQVARILNKQGRISATLGDYADSERYLNQALKLSVAVKDTLTESQTLFYLAKSRHDQGRDSEALKLVRLSVAKTELSGSELTNSKLRMLYFSSLHDRFELLVKLAGNLGLKSNDSDLILEAFQYSEKSKARAILENLVTFEDEVIIDADPVLVQRKNEVRSRMHSKSDKLNQILQQQREGLEVDELSAEISELEYELDEIKAKILQDSPVYAATRFPKHFDPMEFIARQLDEETVLVEFFLADDESYLWVLDKSGLSLHKLPPRRIIEDIVSNFRALLTETQIVPGEMIEEYQKRTAINQRSQTELLLKLSHVLFSQVSDRIQDRNLIVVPDGGLQFAPIGLLQNPNRSPDDGASMAKCSTLAPSAQILLALSRGRKKETPTSHSLLIFFDPVFSDRDERLTDASPKIAKVQTTTFGELQEFSKLDSLSRLESSGAEGEHIGKFIGENQTEKFVGFSATRESLLRLRVGEFKILHFATHGITDEERPELSGLVLSRFNGSGEPIDAFIRLQDIYAMKLNADLVVLSACETGIGKNVRGEGLMSLNNAFLQSGAKTVVSSLWKVEDGATLELMTHFYTAMIDERMTPAAALRKAQMKLRQNPRFSSPFYWAAFTVSGDFKNVPQISRGYSWWVYSIPAVALIIALLFFARRRCYSTRKP